MKTEAGATLAGNEKAGDYAAALTWMMRDARGRWLMRRWLAASGVFTSSWEGSEGREAALAVAYNEGRKAFAYKRLAELKRFVPELFLLMQKEGLNA